MCFLQFCCPMTLSNPAMLAELKTMLSWNQAHELSVKKGLWFDSSEEHGPAAVHCQTTAGCVLSKSWRGEGKPRTSLAFRR